MSSSSPRFTVSAFRLGAFLRAWDGSPFTYGETDCLQFAGAWIGAVTGDNPAAEYAGTYHDEWEAAKLLHRLFCAKGGGGVEAALSASCDPMPVARTGDFVLARGIDDQPAAGIINGNLITAQGLHGLTSQPRLRIEPGWRIKGVI